MSAFEIFAMAMLFVLIACVYAYAHITNNIIRDQEKQIAKLRTENHRMQVALRGRHFVKRVEYHDEQHTNPKAQVIEIHDSTVDPENVPDFNKEW